MSGSLEFFDTHAHLPMLTHDALDAICERARGAGVTRMVTVATDEKNWESSRDCALTRENVHYTLGLHPHDAVRWHEVRERLESFFVSDRAPEKCVAIGEMGLDFHYNFSPREQQIECFEAQLTLARRYDLPVIIHCRDAFEDLFASIKKVGLSSRGGVMHCFTGKTPDALAAVALGLKISFSGILTFKTAEDIREAARSLPESALLLETDCPFLAPIPHRGKKNEPAFLPLTAQVLAGTRGQTLAEIAQITTTNARAFFGV